MYSQSTRLYIYALELANYLYTKYRRHPKLQNLLNPLKSAAPNQPPKICCIKFVLKSAP